MFLFKKKNKEKEKLYNLYHNKSFELYNSCDYSEALKSFKFTLDYSIKLNKNIFITKSLYEYIINCYKNLGDITNTVKYTKYLILFCKENNIKDDVIKNYINLSYLMKNKKLYCLLEALKYCEKSMMNLNNIFILKLIIDYKILNNLDNEILIYFQKLKKIIMFTGYKIENHIYFVYEILCMKYLDLNYHETLDKNFVNELISPDHYLNLLDDKIIHNNDEILDHIYFLLKDKNLKKNIDKFVDVI